MPTARELQSLRVCSTGFVSGTRDLQDGGEAVSKYCKDNASKPTIDTAQLPQTPTDDWFWSSSPYVGSANDAWDVYFYDRGGYGSIRDNTFHVRLVRAGQ